MRVSLFWWGACICECVFVIKRVREAGGGGLRVEEMLVHVYLLCIYVCLDVIITTEIRA